MQPKAPFKHAQTPHRMQSYRWRSYKITIYKFTIITCSCLYLFSSKLANYDGLLFISMSMDTLEKSVKVHLNESLVSYDK